MTHKAVPNRPLIVKAGEYNDAMEAGQWFAKQRALGASVISSIPGVNPCVVRVRNDTGGDLLAGSVLELTTTPLTTLTRENIWLSAVSRYGSDPSCAVLLEAIPYNAWGAAQVAGCCLASVNIVDADNTHARVQAGSTTLQGDFGGWARILHKPSGTGTKTCVVLLACGEQIVRRATASGTINAASSGTASIYVGGSVKGTATVYNDWISTPANIPNGTELYVQYFHDEDKWRIVGAECV